MTRVTSQLWTVGGRGWPSRTPTKLWVLKKHLGKHDNVLPVEKSVLYSQKQTWRFQDEQTSPFVAGDLSPPQMQQSQLRAPPGGRACPRAKTEQSLKIHEENSEPNKEATKKHTSHFLVVNKRHFTGEVSLLSSPGFQESRSCLPFTNAQSFPNPQEEKYQYYK